MTKIGFDINAVNGGGSDGSRSRRFGVGPYSDPTGIGLSVVRIRKEARTGPTEESRGTDERDASLETGRGTIVASLVTRRFGRLSMDASRLCPRRDHTAADKLWRPDLSG